jgi:hypothetical protein
VPRSGDDPVMGRKLEGIGRLSLTKTEDKDGAS